MHDLKGYHHCGKLRKKMNHLFFILPFFSQEKEEGMAVEIKDEMTVEVFISICLTENYFYQFPCMV